MKKPLRFRDFGGGEEKEWVVGFEGGSRADDGVNMSDLRREKPKLWRAKEDR